MEFVTSYDELNSFARKVESELEQKKKELLYIQHTGNNLQLGNGRGIADDSHFSYPKHDSSMSPATEVKAKAKSSRNARGTSVGFRKKHFTSTRQCQRYITEA